MFVGNVWIFIVLAAVSLSEVSGVETQRHSARRWRWRCKTPSPQPPPFFAGNRRPEGLPGISRGKEIPQTLPDDPAGTVPYFVSLFDPDRNIPFYSAYKVTPQQAALIGTCSRGDVSGRWRNPPGVPGLNDAYKKAIKQEPLSRGHMNPLAINTFDKSFMEATFTLTNAVPQCVASNSGPWQIFERKIRNYANKTCGSRARNGTLYLMTGTSDYSITTNLHKPVQDSTIKLFHAAAMLLDEIKLVIPRAVWTAGCCVWKESSQVLEMVWREESFAVISNNVKDKMRLNQTEMSVSEMERHLTAPGSPSLNLFPGDENCRLPKNNVVLT